MPATSLGWRNFEFVSARSGLEGTRILREADFDVAILDFKMEDMKGIEVLKVFKKMCPRMAVIMLTGTALSRRRETELLSALSTG